MDQPQDFSALQNLLASTRLDYPKDTQVDQFLADFHHRQRAQLLVRTPLVARSVAWVRNSVSGLQLVPSLSYAAVAAAIAITVCVGLSQQVQVVTDNDGQSKLSFRLSARDTSFAMVPASLAPVSAATLRTVDAPTFSANRAEAAATRYVLANNSPGAYDKTVAF